MKKVIIATFIILLLSGCSSNPKDISETLSLSDKKIEKLNSEIDEQLQNCLWNYNQSTNTFVKGNVETKESPRYNSIYDASLDMGFDIKKYEGREVIIVSTNITHFNNNEAGTAYFYFIGNELVCEYYVYNDNVYSLKSKDVFLKEKQIQQYEDNNIKADFEESKFDLSFVDFEDIDNKNNSIAVIDNERLKFFSYKDNGFTLKKELNFLSEELYPMDITFTENGRSAVLLGKIEQIYNQNSENGSEENAKIDVEESDDKSKTVITRKKSNCKSVKVIFLDKYFNKISGEIPLDLSIYTSIAYNDSSIILAREKSLDIYKEEDNKWNKVSQFMFKHGVNNIKLSDIENDGENEFVMIDGMDIYIYEFKSTLELLWKTNLSISSITNNLYIADLNNDGINEIYIHDLSGTTARYILCKDGFQSNSSGISYEQKYIAGDFNGDGKDDYICINVSDSTAELFMSK